MCNMNLGGKITKDNGVLFAWLLITDEEILDIACCASGVIQATED